MRVLWILLAALFLAACGSGKANPSSAAQSSAVASLPTTVDGDFAIDVEAGDDNVGANSEYNFGTLTVSGEEIPVVVSGSVLQSAGFSGGASGKVRATIGSKTDEYGPASYVVTSLQRL
jgi:hypothetical protein